MAGRLILRAAPSCVGAEALPRLLQNPLVQRLLATCPADMPGLAPPLSPVRCVRPYVDDCCRGWGHSRRGPAVPFVCPHFLGICGGFEQVPAW